MLLRVYTTSLNHWYKRKKYVEIDDDVYVKLSEIERDFVNWKTLCFGTTVFNKADILRIEEVRDHETSSI